MRTLVRLRLAARIAAGWCSVAAALSLLPGAALAQGFAVFLSPSRFELKAAPGETRREVLEFHHVGLETGRYRIYTNDWEFRSDHSVRFMDTLLPDTCRPWIALERRELSLASNGRYRFRFEVTPPPDTPARECRFALMVEGVDPAKFEGQNLNVPVAGRVGVIVYVQIGDAAPRLAYRAAGLTTVDGKRLPTLEVTNAGNAHGRLEGFLTGKDAQGKSFDLAPDSSPILPGGTRMIVIRPSFDGAKEPPPIAYPLSVKGTLEWGKNRESVDLRFEP